jgi:tetratricopeptide (TPR) repeat protein
MKKAALIFLGITISTLTFAQGKYGKTPQDSVACIESLIYKDYIKNEPKLALELWKKAYEICPQSQKSLYTNGVKLYKHFIKEEKDAVNKEALIDTMLSIHDKRIEMFGQKGFVLGLKGQDMLVYRPKQMEKTFELLNQSIELLGDKTQSGTLVAVMFAVINLEKSGKKTKAEVVEMYEKTMAFCAANKENPKTTKRYTKAEQKIGNVTAKYLDCTVLVPLAEKNFEANKTELAWLRRTTKLLKSKKCYEAPIFSQVAEAYFQLEPSASAAEGMGKLFLGKKNYSKAIEFFKKALEMAETGEEKAEYTFSIAQAYAYNKQYAQAKSNALKAAALKKGWGEPYILIGDLYAQSAKSCDDGEIGKFGVYWAAVDKYQKAKAVDASVASAANKKIASISSHYPTTKDLFFYGKAKGDAYTVKCWINENTTIRTK